MADFVTAFAPASIGNVGVGFDMLGLALHGAGDAEVRRPQRIPDALGALVGGASLKAESFVPIVRFR